MPTQADKIQKKLRILIVDDEPLNSKLLAAHFVNDPYEITQLDNGQACLQKLAREPFDLVLLDVMMPKMNGFDVCRHIKQNPATKELPIIFITSLIDPEHKQSGFDAGGVDYITKPFDVCEVKARIKTHLSLKVARDELRNQNLLLDEKVRERTAELAEINKNLKEEMAARQHAHDRLRVSEAKIRAMLTAMPDKVHHISKQGNILECTGNAELFTASLKNIKGKNIGQLLPRDIADAIRRQIAAALQGIDIAIAEHQASTSKGRRTYEIRMVKIADDEVLAITRDITEKKQAEETLLKSEAHLRQENMRLKSSIKERYRFGDIIGKSTPMQQVYDLILEAAETDAGVIIYGESGTGKELVARAIHTMSGRVNNAFVPVNSGAIPENLLESEFFGYKKGAFTGATTDKHGFFDVADGGTMFLDEIGEIGLTMQVKLLRAIENGEYTPVGSSQTAKADVRIIAATNKDLPQLVKEGAIREDFFIEFTSSQFTCRRCDNAKKIFPC